MDLFQSFEFLSLKFSAIHCPSEQEISEPLLQLKKQGKFQVFVDWLFEEYEQKISVYKGKFYEELEVDLCSAFGLLHEFLLSFKTRIELLSKFEETSRPLIVQFEQMYLIVLFSSQKNMIHEHLYRYFSSNLEEHITDPDTQQSPKMTQICSYLRSLHLLDLSEEIFTEILFTRIRERISTNCTGSFDQKLLSDLIEWMDQVIYPWLPTIMTDPLTFSQWKTRLDYFVYERFALLKMAELFEIIVEFPESIPALQDLKICLEKTNLKPILTTSLQKILSTRLLHSGPATSDIISQYISTVKSLQIIDPSGIVLEAVSEPVRVYLSGREDTIRCIVSSCTEDESSELFQDLSNSSATSVNPLINNKEDLLDWEPDPIDFISNSTNIRKKKDMLSMMVGIYGTPELFVQEYRTMLSERLLSVLDYDIDKEIRILELLKLRFGDHLMHNCSVMLRDLGDSKRIHNLCKEKLSDKELPLQCTILSYLFWPMFREEKLNLPEKIQQSFEEYSKAFQQLKQSRSLQLKPTLGTVELDLEFGEKTLSFSVSPVHATLILAFEEQNVWSLEKLSAKVGLPSDQTRKRLGYWINQGVLCESSPEIFELTEPASELQDNLIDEPVELIPELSAEEEEKLRICENFVIGMLKTLGPLPIERINSMLSAYVENYTFSLHDLGNFLQKCVRDDKFEFSGTVYSIKK